MRLILAITTCFLLLNTYEVQAQFNFGKDKKKKEKEKKKDKNVDRNAIFGLIYENELSPNFGAQHLLSDHQLVSRLQNKFIPAKIFKKDAKIASFGNALFRLTKVGLLDYPMTYLTGTMQRELFGTQFRANELGAIGSVVNYGIPQPYGSGGGKTSITFDKALTLTEQSLTTLAGTESSAVLSSITSKNSVLNNHFLYEEGLMFLFSNNELAFKLATGKDYANKNIKNYMNQMDTLYGVNAISMDKLKILSYLDIGLDGMNINAIASLFNYIGKGEEQLDVLAFKLNESISYLPSFKMLLAPYGPEVLFKQFVKKGKTLFQLDIRTAAASSFSSLGVDLNIFNLLLGEKKKISIDGFLAAWNQPEMNLTIDNALKTIKGFGGGGSATINYRFLKNTFIQARLGYKSKGYYQGLSLNNDLIFNIGFAFR